MENQNIISIRAKDKLIANRAFDDFMKLTEDYMNNKAKQEPSFFAHMNASDLEKESEMAMKIVSPQTPFRKDEITLVSAQTFPDIIAEKYFGVEVKSTKKDHWSSTGSSIVESTRNPNVENIYMLFGKLGGECPQFKCKPYSDCLYDIAVTHSPRYLINMELGKGETIFEKMGVSYDELRTSENSIEQVRHYYKEQAQKQNKKEMPWWLAGKSAQSSFNLKHFSTISSSEKKDIIAEIFILFPDIISNKNNDKFINLSLWLCTYHYILASNLRDSFSAGGKVKYINNELLSNPIPSIFKHLTDISHIILHKIHNLMEDNDNENFISVVKEFNPNLLSRGKKNILNTWLNMIQLHTNIILGKNTINMRKIILEGFILSR